MEEVNVDRAETQIGFLRFYDPNLQRWPSRDPLGEAGFEAMIARKRAAKEDEAMTYVFVRNRPVDTVDQLGLMAYNLGKSCLDGKKNVRS